MQTSMPKHHHPPRRTSRNGRLLAAAFLITALAALAAVHGPSGCVYVRDYLFGAGPKAFPSLAESSALTALWATGACVFLCLVSAFGLCAHRSDCGRSAVPASCHRHRRLRCCLALGVALLLGATAVHCFAFGDAAPSLPDEGDEVATTTVSTKPSSTGGEHTDAATAAAAGVVSANATCREVLDAAFRACRGDSLADSGSSEWFGDRKWYGGQYYFGRVSGGDDVVDVDAASPRCSAPDASVKSSPGALPAVVPDAVIRYGAHIDGTPCAAAMSVAVAHMGECGGDLLTSDPPAASHTTVRKWNNFRGASPPTWSAQLRTLDDENICACGGVVEGPGRLREVLQLGCGLDPVLVLVTCAAFLCNVALFRLAIYMMLRRDDEQRTADGAHDSVRSRCFHFVLSAPLALLATLLFWTTGPLFLMAAGLAVFFLKKRRANLNCAPHAVGFGHGEFGPSVAQMQFALASLGHLPTLRPWDVGVFGPKTTKALRAFQEQHHVVAKPADTYDAATKAAMNAALLVVRRSASHEAVATQEVVGTVVKDEGSCGGVPGGRCRVGGCGAAPQ